MHNRLKETFASKKNILAVYYTAGFPTLLSTLPTAIELQEAGADIIEIGIPYSDPVADGPVIQDSGSAALNNGISLNVIFNQLAKLRQQVTIPVVLMGYWNSVVNYGIPKFLNNCKKVGIDGCIFPDLPLHVYNKSYRKMFTSAGIANIFLITPQTPAERIKQLDEASSGFLYVLSSASVTGGSLSLNDATLQYFGQLKNYDLKNPTLIGFGIDNHERFAQACTYANGAIVGSAFIRAQNSGISPARFVKTIKGTI